MLFNCFEVGFRAVQIRRLKKKTVEVLEGDDLGGRAFALFLRPHPGEFAHFFEKNANARGVGPGGGMGTAGIDWRINVMWFLSRFLP